MVKSNHRLDTCEALVELCETDLVWQGRTGWVQTCCWWHHWKYGLIVGENIDDRLRASHVQFSQECRAHKIRCLICIFSKVQHLQEVKEKSKSLTQQTLVDHNLQSLSSKEIGDKCSLCHLDINFGMGSWNLNMATHCVVWCVETKGPPTLSGWQKLSDDCPKAL